MMNNFIYTIFKRFNDLIYQCSLIVKSKFRDLFSYLFLFLILYYFVGDISLMGFITLIISFVISFLISHFILNKFVFSKNLFVRIIQKIVIYNIIFITLFFILSFFDINILNKIDCAGDDVVNAGDVKNTSDSKHLLKVETQGADGDKKSYNINIDKELGDKIATNIGKVVAKSIDVIAPNVGAGAAAGTIGAAALKASAGLPPAQRLTFVGGSAAVGALGTKIGLDAGAAISKNLILTDSLKNSPHANPNVDHIPSPTDSGPFIFSVLEDDSIPLLDLIENLFSLNVLEFILIIFLIYLLCQKYVNNFNINFISNFIKKYLPNKFQRFTNILQTGGKINNKVSIFMIVLIFILIIFFKLLQIYITYELSENIDDYVLVYNHIKKNSLIILINYNVLFNKNINKIKNKYYSTLNDEYNSSVDLKQNLSVTSRSAGCVAAPASSPASGAAGCEAAATDKNMKNLDYLELDLNTKINKFGSYSNYLKKIEEDNVVNDDFLLKYYPDLIDDDDFRNFLKEIKPIVRKEVKYILDLYQCIKKYNSFKDKILFLNKYIDEHIYNELFKELDLARKEIFNILTDLNYSNSHSKEIFTKLIYKLDTNLKNQILLDFSILNKEVIENFKNEVDFVNNLNFIKKLIKKDLVVTEANASEVVGDNYISLAKRGPGENEIESKFIDVEDLFLKIFSLMKYLQENNLISNNNFLDKYKNELTVFSNSDKFETYKIKKGDIRKRRLRPGLILAGYKDILNNMKKELEVLILKDFKDIFSSNNIKNELLENKNKLLDRINLLNKVFLKDFETLYKNVNKIFDIRQFISKISHDLSDTNIKSQYKSFNNFFENIFIGSDTNHDELLSIFELINKYNINYIRIDDINISRARESSFTNNSYLYLKCREIIISKNIKPEKKQFILENFILNYEKEFTLNIIKKLDSNVNDYKLLTRIYKHSTPQFKARIQAFIDNNRKRKFEDYYKNKDNISKVGDHLALALFLTIKTDQLINIIFSKIIRLIASNGGLTQNELLVNLSDEMLITFKYNLNSDDNDNKYDNLSEQEKTIIYEIKEKIDVLPFESKYKFGDLLLELILDEFEYMFVKTNVYENNQHFIYISIKPEYLNILAGSIFNPIKLPMIAKPKEWIYTTIDNTDKIKITEIGGYYLDQFNELNKNNNIIRQNTFNKYDSILSDNQVKSINLLNSKPFEINKEMLNFVVKE